MVDNDLACVSLFASHRQWNRRRRCWIALHRPFGLLSAITALRVRTATPLPSPPAPACLSLTNHSTSSKYIGLIFAACRPLFLEGAPPDYFFLEPTTTSCTHTSLMLQIVLPRRNSPPFLPKRKRASAPCHPPFASPPLARLPVVKAHLSRFLISLSPSSPLRSPPPCRPLVLARALFGKLRTGESAWQPAADWERATAPPKPQFLERAGRAVRPRVQRLWDALPEWSHQLAFCRHRPYRTQWRSMLTIRS